MAARATALGALAAFEKGRIDRLRTELERLPDEPRERALAWELAHGVLRNDRLLDFVLAAHAHRGLPADPVLRSALRLGAYQLLLLSGMPPHAAVHETVALLRHNRAFANAMLRRIADAVEPRPADPQRPDVELPLAPARTFVLAAPGFAACADAVAVRHSLPDFLLARWRRHFGDAAAEVAAAASSARPEVFLRACGGRSGQALAARLANEGVQTAAAARADMVRWTGGGSPFHVQAFRDGWFVAQDPTAVAAAEAVGAGPGMTVVDLCAAPGTKTMLLAERVLPDGVVVATDVDPERRQRIGENARRLGLDGVVRVVDDASALPRADAVLADVPCSNTGVLARRVEVRRRLRPETFARLAATQRTLLQAALAVARPGGRVVYSTCSIEPEENDEVVRASGAVVLREATTLPQAGAHDGGYRAELQANG